MYKKKKIIERRTYNKKKLTRLLRKIFAGDSFAEILRIETVVFAREKKRLFTIFAAR